MIYHVSKTGCDRNTGSAELPFLTINRAASIAVAGDRIIVHEGVYREWVDPKNGGYSDASRIVYEAAEGERVVIKGSEIVGGWERVEGSVWRATVDNSVFGDFNPFASRVNGDWLTLPKTHEVHLGDVYIDGFSLYEAVSVQELMTAPGREHGLDNGLVGNNFDHPLPDSWRTKYLWYAEVGEDTTTILCNFQEKDPTKATVEINVRPCCFYPKADGRNYITVRGFEMCQCASIWAPPSGDQSAMLGPHWSKGWIIENNHLYDAKCNAISLGKDASTGDNEYTFHGRKSGYYNQLEAVFRGLQRGWDRATVGSHIVRNNVIHDCGQTGIVGHMGCAFSRIEHNEIYRISVKQEFWGHEIAGIKFHAPIDTVICDNYVYDCLLGIWVDWQAQGTHICRNVLNNNYQDTKVEITSGPTMIYDNIMLSQIAMQDQTHGLALMHNLIAGCLYNGPATGRPTPYHFPHSTAVLGCTDVYGGDARIINNIFIGQYTLDTLANYCTAFDVYTTPEEFAKQFAEKPSTAGLDKWKELKQPVWIEDNVYSGYASPWRNETGAIVTEDISAELFEKDGRVILTLTVSEDVASAQKTAVTTERLGTTLFSQSAFEEPDASPLDLSHDILGKPRSYIKVGPFAELKAGKNEFTVWKK